MTYIDGIFTRNILNVEILAYVFYFSHYRPLLSIIPAHDNTHSELCNYDPLRYQYFICSHSQW